MPKASDFFPTTASSEIDLRKEITSMFHGSDVEIPKASKIVLRRMRKDSNDNLIKCECVDELTKEPDTDFSCPYCLGSGFKFDEEYVFTRKVTLAGSGGSLFQRDKHLEPGTFNAASAIFYFEFGVKPTYYDRIVEPITDVEGELTVPLTRRKVYRPQTVVEHRSDNGRLEYWAVHCLESEVVLIKDSYIK